MRIDAVSLPIKTITLDSSKISTKANVGDVLNVKVLASSNGEAKLEMPDGKTISVDSKVDLKALVGQTVDMVVTEKKDGKVLLETLNNFSSSNSGITLEQVKNLLSNLKLSDSSKNTQLIQEMMQNQIPVTKENLQTIMSNLAKYPELNVEKAVFMLANGVSFEEKSIDLLNQYAESKVALGNQVESIMKAIDKTDDTDTLKNIAEKLRIFQNNDLHSNIDEASQKIAKNIIDSLISKNDKQITELGGSNQADSAQQDNNTVINKNTESAVNSDILFKSGAKPSEVMNSSEIKILKQIIPLIKQSIIENIDAQIQQNQSAENLPKADVKVLKQEILGLNQNELEGLISSLPGDEKDSIQNMNIMSKASTDGRLLPGLINNHNLNKEMVKELKNQIRDILENNFVKNTSDSLADDLRIKEAYKELLVKLDTIKEAVSSNPNSSELTKLIGQTEDNIRFMNNISQYNTFVQIPLNVWGQNTNGELFVLKKSRKKVDPNNASVFLSLEMPNMGTTEVLVNVFGKNVSLSFRLEDEDTSNLVKKNASKISEAITQLGYCSVDISAGIIQEKTNLLNMSKVTGESAAKLGFDVKI